MGKRLGGNHGAPKMGTAADVITYKSTKEVMAKKPNYALRRGGALVVAAALTVGAVEGGKVAASALEQHRKPAVSYTQEELSKLPQQSVTVEYGEGAQAVVGAVDPGLRDGSDAQGFQDVIAYVQAQGKGPHSDLKNTQSVDVPLVPGMTAQPTPTPSQSSSQK